MELMYAIQLIQNEYIVKNHSTQWADLGCGKGLFTLALAHYLQQDSIIYAVDSNRGALSNVEQKADRVIIKKIQADFIKDDLDFQNLDGIIMANSLHFVRDQIDFLRKAGNWLRPDASILIVEYDADLSNPWVPYPISFRALQQLTRQAGFGTVQQLHQRPSIYNRAPIYSAVIKP